jgi:hypothetical protein
VSEFYTDIIASTGQEDEASALTCKLVDEVSIVTLCCSAGPGFECKKLARYSAGCPVRT